MISVCMAIYNGEKYLHEQVSSILEQLNEDDELVVSDDGSTDSSIQVLESFNDSRIRIIHNKKNHGVNVNFNNALHHAKGKYIFLSDQDDIWLPDKVSVCLDALNNFDCVVHDAIIVDKNLKELKSSFFLERNVSKGFYRNIYRNSYLGCCMAFDRKILDKVLPIPDTKAFFHDGWIGSIVELKFRCSFIPYKGILFRRHDNNTSSTVKNSKFSRRQQLFNRIIQVYAIAKRLVFNI